MRKVFFAALAACFAVLLPAMEAAACSRTTDCKIGDRVYRVQLPTTYDPAKPAGVIIFVHGWRGNMSAAMDNKALIDAAGKLGVILVAAKSKFDGWSLDGRPGGRAPEIDELGYFDAMLADLSRRFSVDPARRMVAGFSGGGMMVWTLACERSQEFAAFVPIAGTFWEPVPTVCETPPANVLHIHGDADGVVPLSGRVIRDAKQGDVFRAIGNYALYGRYGLKPALPDLPALACKHRANATGRSLSFCLFPGGHVWKPAFIEAAWRFFSETGAMPPALTR